jgi:hypothetical protein
MILRLQKFYINDSFDLLNEAIINPATIVSTPIHTKLMKGLMLASTVKISFGVVAADCPLLIDVNNKLTWALVAFIAVIDIFKSSSFNSAGKYVVSKS